MKQGYIRCFSLFFLTLVLASSAQAQNQGQWLTRSPLPTARQEMPLVVLEDKIIVAGGFLAGGMATTLVEVFEPSLNEWTSFPPLPVAMHHLHTAVVDGRLYVLGGYESSSFTPSNKVFVFDPAMNEWERKADMPTARGAGIAIVIEGKIYVIGGEPGFTANEVYDSVTDQWSELTRMPTRREHLAGAAIDSLIYVVGGRTFGSFGEGNKTTLEAYSPETDLWYSLADMPTARGGIAACALNGKLYVFGGEFFTPNSSGVFEETEEYNPTTNTWRTLQPMPVPRHGMGAVAVGDSIFIIGGGPDAGYSVSNVNSIFVPPSSVTSITDETLPAAFALKQNYPNPFNPTTTIEFTLPKTSEVVLRIYNLRGDVVNTLIKGTQSAGVKSVIWDGNDYLGQPVGSGLYFYRLDVGSFTEIRKMTFLK